LATPHQIRQIETTNSSFDTRPKTQKTTPLPPPPPPPPPPMVVSVSHSVSRLRTRIEIISLEQLPSSLWIQSLPAFFCNLNLKGGCRLRFDLTSRLVD
jgi:hypothetical protein